MKTQNSKKVKSPPIPHAAKILYFDGRQGNYWVRLKDGSFLSLDQKSAKLHLREAGLDPDNYTGPLNEVERGLFTAQTERHVAYAGSLAGWQPGPFVAADGSRVLVTSAPRVPAPKSGNCSTLERFVGELLPGEQAAHFCLWLAASVRNLREGSFKPGQMLALCGPSSCGKSLLQHVITAALGGRVANPVPWLFGNTVFNGDLAQAEHWMIEETAGSTDIRTRRKFGEAIKQVVVARNLCVQPKHKQAITLPTYRRLTFSFNSETENVMAMPPLDDSIGDKVNLYLCDRANVGSDEEKTWAAFTAELPAFIHRCLGLTVPKRWRDARYIVAAFHHPHLVETLATTSPQARLLTIIDEAIFGIQSKVEFWSGSAAQLERELLSSQFGHAVSKLLYFTSACGVYLERIARETPRVSDSKRDGKTVWTITSP